MDDRAREFFWGLRVQECRSAAMVGAYFGLANLPGIIFFFLWLFYWKHGSDLQNASVPPLFSLSITLAFASWLFHGHEGNRR